jgi:hypothetical protein
MSEIEASEIEELKIKYEKPLCELNNIIKKNNLISCTLVNCILPIIISYSIYRICKKVEKQSLYLYI